MANTIQAVIWDLDGVIIDSAEEHRRAWHRLAQEQGLPFTDEQFYAEMAQRREKLKHAGHRARPAARTEDLSHSFNRFGRQT